MSLRGSLRKALGIEDAAPDAGPLPGTTMSREEAENVLLGEPVISDEAGQRVVTLLALTAMSEGEFMPFFTRLAAGTPTTPEWLRDEFYRREAQKVETSMRRATLVMAWLTAAIAVLTVVNVVVVAYHH